MTPPLFLLDPLPDGDVVVLGGPEGRHAARVRRIGVGEVLDVSDGRGAVARCAVSSVGDDALVLRVLARRIVTPPEPRIVVVQALAKGNRGELAVELLTEVGVDVIVPWAASRSVTKWEGARGERSRERWRSTAREAAKQCRRPVLPDVTSLHTTAQVASLITQTTSLVLHEAASAPLAAVTLPHPGDLVLVVGPEGGISEAELATFTAAGATPVRLGPEVLRTSTAGVAAVAALSVALERWT
ncbi:MAG: 16S rRNA (uracil(1498)-N(3))-methyltransferase [Geodermatophilaceae bacterium]|nr:16S rRNA (uracil(1498)-N(3))-methyltransferase [Geodermatophilaceae bacterium]